MRKHLLNLLLIRVGIFVFQEISSFLGIYTKGKSLLSGNISFSYGLIKVVAFLIFFLFMAGPFVAFEKFYRKSLWKAILYAFLSIIAAVSLRNLIEEQLAPYFFGWDNYKNETWLFYFFDNFIFAINYASFGIAYFFILNEKRSITERTKLLLAHKQAELSFLQSQLRPHFLFNALNSIYAMVYHHSENSLKAIASFSDLLRYMLYEQTLTVPVEKELEYVKQFIELQQLRFPESNIDLQEEVMSGSCQIPTGLLLAIAENTFKHGDLSAPITICIQSRGVSLYVFFRNKMKTNDINDEQGLGLNNCRKRLALIYPGAHTLNIRQEQDFFILELTISVA